MVQEIPRKAILPSNLQATIAQVKAGPAAVASSNYSLSCTV